VRGQLEEYCAMDTMAMVESVMSLADAAPMLASNNFRKPPHRFVSIHLAIVIHEQPVVY
jgi:hypothetical protein